MKKEAYPFISVVVCAFNEEKLLADCLTGLSKQNYPQDRYEILIIDDESTDNTFEISERFIASLSPDSARARVARIVHGGLSVARNSGIQLSEGEIVAFIDGDAVADPDWLIELSKPFLSGADYVGGRIDCLNTDSWVAMFLQRTRNRQFFGPKVFSDHCIGCNMAFRREVFEAVEGFHENFISRGDESTLQARIRKNFHYAPAPDAVVLHERPDSLIDGAKVEWKSATLRHLSAMASEAPGNWKYQVLLVEQFLMILFPLFLCLIWLAPNFFWLPLAVTGAATLRRTLFRPLNRAIAQGLVSDYGFIRGVVAHFIYCWVQNTLLFFGNLLSPWLHRDAKIVAPMTTPLSIETLLDTHAAKG